MNTLHLHQSKNVHLVGIKGVGMTALALCLQDMDKIVTGSDVADEFVTAEVLHQRGLDDIGPMDAAHIPQGVDLVIYSGANGGINNAQVQVAISQNIRAISHAEALGELSEGKIAISVCGVGGKTSISAMLANILEYANLKPSFVIGVGKVLNLQTPGRLAQGRHIVLEADEYAISPGTNNNPRFTYQKPELIICTNIAHDHPDVYPSIEDTKKTFSAFFDRLQAEGKLIANGDSDVTRGVCQGRNVIFYGEKNTNDWYIKGSFIGQGKQLITVGHQDQQFNLMLSVPGIFNATNALAAYIAALELGVDHQTAIEGLQLFRGSKRRFEKIGEQDNIVYYDDYAHHPSEVDVTLKAAREWLPLFRIVCVFQPHTYSRTKQLLPDFAKSFTHADEVIITDIYGGREENDPSISGFQLSEAIKQNHQNVEYVPQQELINHLKQSRKPYDMIITMGAGDVYKIHQELV
jgi:UDP-N-acetylmuramate--alanine ligase